MREHEQQSTTMNDVHKKFKIFTIHPSPSKISLCLCVTFGKTTYLSACRDIITDNDNNKNKPCLLHSKKYVKIDDVKDFSLGVGNT